MKKLITLILGITLAFSSYATHLMGGQISATYLSSDTTSGQYFVNLADENGIAITTKKLVVVK